MTETPAQAEVAGHRTVEFDHFGRTWTVPARLRLSHLRALQHNPSPLAIIDTILTSEQVEALEEIDPEDNDLKAFADEMERAMGYRKGNSSASPASS